MVEVRVNDNEATFEPLGLHKLWAFKRRIRVPLSAVKHVRRLDAETARKGWKGLRLPGTHLPSVFAAGTFYRDGQWHFWDVRDAQRVIEVELDGVRYARLFVEVADPDATVEMLHRATQR